MTVPRLVPYDPEEHDANQRETREAELLARAHTGRGHATSPPLDLDDNPQCCAYEHRQPDCDDCADDPLAEGRAEEEAA